MRRPEVWDRHGETTPTPFSFPNLNRLFTPTLGEKRQIKYFTSMETSPKIETLLFNMQAVVDKMSSIFDSHDFILMLLREYPELYGEYLIKHSNVTRAHGEISNYLRCHASELGINELPEKVNSEDIFRIIRPCAQWKKQL